MNKIRISLIATTIVLSIIACRKDDLGISSEVEIIHPIGNESYLSGSSDYIFDQNTLHSFELTIPLSELKKIDSAPVAEEYVEGSLKFNGEELSPVGIRYKGSVGAFVGAVSGKDWSNPSGHKTATKISMKVKIDWKGSDQTFYGLKKLQFHAQNMDPSQMHERLGYWLYREMGVAAPRSVHARLIINGEYYGVYALTEQIDEQFIAYNYKDHSGNLYKEVWPLNYLGEANDQNEFLENLKTNETEEPDVNMMKSFADDIVVANDDELRALIIERMNLDQIISYTVVDVMIRNDDGAFHWYCGSEGCSNHNYYWYEEPSIQKIHLIPWDLDNAFQNIGYGKSPVTRIHNKWGEISNDCEPFPSYTHGIYQKSAACDKLTGGWVSFRHEYDSLKTVFKNGPFSEEVVNAKIDEWSDQIREATIEARMMHRDAVREKKWDEALENLKGELAHSRLSY
ncbi:MAG: CotH kinase family protein [Prolixibacteraceae bacterium]